MTSLTSRTLQITAIRDAVREDKAVTVVLRNYKKDGTPFWNLLHVCPIGDLSGQVAWYFGVQVRRKTPDTHPIAPAASTSVGQGTSQTTHPTHATTRHSPLSAPPSPRTAQTEVSDEAAAALNSAEGTSPVHSGEHLEVFNTVSSLPNVAERCVNLVRCTFTLSASALQSSCWSFGRLQHQEASGVTLTT